MAEAMNRDGQLAGSIVALSTLLSIVTISIGLYLLMM
jgi:predicted permease